MRKRVFPVVALTVLLLLLAVTLNAGSIKPAFRRAFQVPQTPEEVKWVAENKTRVTAQRHLVLSQLREAYNLTGPEWTEVDVDDLWNSRLKEPPSLTQKTAVHSLASQVVQAALVSPAGSWAPFLLVNQNGKESIVLVKQATGENYARFLVFNGTEWVLKREEKK